jgi:hypothetical protein
LQIHLPRLFNHTCPVRQRNELSRRFAVGRSDGELEAGGSEFRVFQDDREFVGRFRNDPVGQPLYPQSAVRGIEVAVGVTHGAVRFTEAPGVSRRRSIFVTVADTGDPKQQQDRDDKE